MAKKEDTKTPSTLFVLPKGMHESTVDSMGIEDLFKYYEFDNAEACDAAAGEAGACNRLSNLYMRQKGVLVDGRRLLVAKLIALTGFARLTTTKSVTKDGVESKIVVPDETEAEWFSRLKKAILTKVLTVAGLDAAGEPQFEVSVRKIAHALVDDDGAPFYCDPRKAVRESKEKKLAQQWLDAAKAIIERGGPARVSYWKGVFEKGGEDVSTPTPYQPFDVKPAHNASAEERAALLATNIANLGWAIKAHNAKVQRYV